MGEIQREPGGQQRGEVGPGKSRAGRRQTEGAGGGRWSFSVCVSIGRGGGGSDSRPEGKKRGAFEGGFLGRKRAPPVPQLTSLPHGAEAGGGGGSDSSSSTASPSPTKMSTSPRHRKGTETSSQEYSL